MTTSHRLSHSDAVDWAALYHRAVAAGCERAISRAEERLAAADELLAHVPAELVYLSELVTLRQLSPCPHMVVIALARQAGGRTAHPPPRPGRPRPRRRLRHLRLARAGLQRRPSGRRALRL